MASEELKREEEEEEEESDGDDTELLLNPAYDEVYTILMYVVLRPYLSSKTICTALFSVVIGKVYFMVRLHLLSLKV